MKIKWNEVTWYSRILALVIFLALPFLGFYLGYRYGIVQMSAPVIVLTSPRGDATAIDEISSTSSWATFQSDKYGFSFRYPMELEMMNPVGMWKYFASATSTGVQVVKLEVPKIFEPGTNFGDAEFNVGVSSASSDMQDCFLPMNGEAASSTLYLNGTTFYGFAGEDAGAGNYYQVESYRAVHDNACYDIDMIVHSTNLANYPPEFGLKQFDENKIHGLLSEILQSFTFTQ